MQNQQCCAKYTEICLGCLPFYPHQCIAGARILDHVKGVLHLVDGGLQGCQIDPLRMVAPKAIQKPTAIIDFSRQKHLGNLQAFFRVCGTVLFCTQQHITIHRTRYPGQKAAMLCQKAQAYVPFNTGSHQRGTGSTIAKGHYIFQIMQRNTSQCFIAIQDHNVLAIQGQIRIGRGDVQRVLQCPHSSTSNARRTYSLAETPFDNSG